MRKIETLMNAAITDNANWAMANTQVTLNAEGEGRRVFFFFFFFI